MRRVRCHLTAQHLKNAFLHRPFCASPSHPFPVPLSAGNQLAPRSLLRFEVPGSANKAVICRAGCCVAVCHVPRRHEIAFRSKRAKMAREERITYVCMYVCARACAGAVDATPVHRPASLYTLQIFARPRASLVRERPTKLCVDNADGAFRAPASRPSL